MKSSRQAALAPKGGVRPNKINLGHEAGAILKSLERAKNYNNKRRYNLELRKLSEKYPQYAASILALLWK
jgi:hypothetical protein